MLDTAALAFALALLAGVIGQAIGRHLLVPGIVVLLGTGVLLGPDVANVIRPEALGPGLDSIVSFAVAVIMFEGGMRLDLGALRKEGTVIRRLVTIGALITAVGGALACRAIMGWDWRLSVLFGTLVIVTGPTVVGPLVRRIRLAVSLATILDAEGIFIDAVGAMIAITALEVALSPAHHGVGAVAIHVVERVGTGIVVGLVGGFALGGLLRSERLVPHGLENILALSGAVAIFMLSHGIAAESGIPAAVTAGMVVGNQRIQRMHELVEFKEQLTTMLIGLLFVLLAADIRIADVVALGWPALLVVAALSLLVRPLAVLVCSRGSSLRLRDKLFVGWIGPRGIVAAAVASLFAKHLADAGVSGGVELRALVFTVIAVTVTVQGLSAGPIARALGLRRAIDSGYVFLGANPVVVHLAKRLVEAGEPVQLIDFNPQETRLAQEQGLKVIFGNGLEARTLHRARTDTRAHAVAATTNESVNLLFARRVIDEFFGPIVHVAVDPTLTGVKTEMVAGAGGKVLFGRPEDLIAWNIRFRKGQIEFRTVVATEHCGELGDAPLGTILALLVQHGSHLTIIDGSRPAVGDRVELAIATERRDHAAAWLAESGWIDAPHDHGESSSGSAPTA